MECVATKLTVFVVVPLSVLFGACDLTEPELIAHDETTLLPTTVVDTWVLNERTLDTNPPSRRPDFMNRPDGGYLFALYPDPGQLRVYDSNRNLENDLLLEFPLTYSFAIEHGFVVVGYEGQEGYKVTIVDATLNEQQQFTFSTTAPDLFPKTLRLAQIANGSYVLLIVRRKGTTPNNVLAAFSVEGLLWMRDGDGRVADSQFALSDVAPDGQGGFVSVGYRYPLGSESILMNFDSDGDVQWQRSYSARRWNKLTEVGRVANGDYVLSGQNQGLGEVHGWYLQVDQSGTVVWDSERLWTEEAKQQSLLLGGDYNIVYLHSTPSKTFVVGQDYGLGKLITFEIDESSLLQRYVWPLELRNCMVSRIRIIDDGKLGVLASYRQTERLGSTTWRSVVKTLYFTLQ